MGTMRIGAHMSVAGGVSLAVDRAALHGCEALQIFAKNASQWQGKALAPDEVRRFRRRVEETGITPVVSHASYLINLATAVPARNAAAKLKKAAQMTALPGVRTRVDTTVAIELAASWKPLM